MITLNYSLEVGHGKTVVIGRGFADPHEYTGRLVDSAGTVVDSTPIFNYSEVQVEIPASYVTEANLPATLTLYATKTGRSEETVATISLTKNMGLSGPLRTGNRILLGGTSVENLTGQYIDTLVSDIPANTIGIPGRSWYVWYEAFSGGRASLTKNVSISGSTSAQQLDAVDAVLADYAANSDWYFTGYPVNDPATGIPFATTLANMTALFDKVQAAGLSIMLLTPVPSSNYNVNSNNKQYLSDGLKWARELPLHRQGVVVVDAYRILTDPATGAPRPGGTPTIGGVLDGVHPSDEAAMRLGKEVSDVMAPLIPLRRPSLYSSVDPRNSIANPHLSSNGSGWTAINGTGVTISYLSADNGWGNKAVLTFSGVNDSIEHGIQCVEPITNGRYAVGDIIRLTARFKFSNLVPISTQGSVYPYLRLWPRLADNSFSAFAAGMTTSSSEQVVPTSIINSGEVVSSSLRVRIPNMTSNLYVMVGWKGIASGIIEISDIACRKDA